LTFRHIAPLQGALPSPCHSIDIRLLTEPKNLTHSLSARLMHNSLDDAHYPSEGYRYVLSRAMKILWLVQRVAGPASGGRP